MIVANLLVGVFVTVTAIVGGIMLGKSYKNNNIVIGDDSITYPLFVICDYNKILDQTTVIFGPNLTVGLTNRTEISEYNLQQTKNCHTFWKFLENLEEETHENLDEEEEETHENLDEEESQEEETHENLDEDEELLENLNEDEDEELLENLDEDEDEELLENLNEDEDELLENLDEDEDEDEELLENLDEDETHENLDEKETPEELYEQLQQKAIDHFTEIESISE